MSDERFADELDPTSPPASEEAARIRGYLADDAMWETPDASLEERVVAMITDRSAEEAKIESGAAAPRPLLFRPVAVSLGAAAVIALIVLGAIVLRPTDRRSATEFFLQGTELAARAGAEAVITTTDAGFAIRLEISGLPPAPIGSFYEGWVLGDEGSVSIGTFHMRGNAPIGLWSGVDPARYPTVNITVQEEGAGPESSGLIVLTGVVPAD